MLGSIQGLLGSSVHLITYVKEQCESGEIASSMLDNDSGMVRKGSFHAEKRTGYHNAHIDYFSMIEGRETMDEQLTEED